MKTSLHTLFVPLPSVRDQEKRSNYLEERLMLVDLKYYLIEVSLSHPILSL